jgi:NAD(P)-dependent dehydrogenase (short-subunit alcohol dehydrogenase family)
MHGIVLLVFRWILLYRVDLKLSMPEAVYAGWGYKVYRGFGCFWGVYTYAYHDLVRRPSVLTCCPSLQLGPPTILVNNAATTINGLPLISSPRKQGLSLSPEQADKTMTTNALSHFNTLSILLPHLTSSLRGAHIVSISSTLAHLAPARLADYSMSKAAVSSLHQTLRHELRSHQDPSVFAKVKTLLVEPGQLDTQLFADNTSVPFYAHFFGPVLEAKDLAKEIVKTIERGDGGVIRLPFYAKFMPFYAGLPGTLQLFVRWFSGIDRAIVEKDKRS